MHGFEPDPGHADGNCRCGAPREHRMHEHEFVESRRRPGDCICGLGPDADCHPSDLWEGDTPVLTEEDVQILQTVMLTEVQDIDMEVTPEWTI